MQAREFKVEIDNGIATVTFNWPNAANAMGTTYSSDFSKILDRIEQDENIRCVVLTGAGKVFNGGGDLKELMSPDPTEMESEFKLLRDYNKITKRLYYFDIPVIAALNGPAIGGGVGIALACDFAIASETARYDLAFHKLGLSAADVGVPWLLTRAIGAPLANYHILTTGSIDSILGKKLGLFAEVVPQDDLLNAAMVAARRIASAPGPTVRISKLSLRRGVDMDFAANLEVEAYMQSYAFRSEGHKKIIGEYRRKISKSSGN
ncbi:Enoyl-CoA hydratase (plasmid) [Cupriavidus sp. U2]|uniref:enoyl-CoA hydratase/isomerase family protein n=1 Tax=Cupriavidus sp. U2 TaxID=2920269 RepID=UPI00129D5AF4|nr:enoyl-CoA hydratase/isomerase family protein [Cupriavidus sp. U2]KAI3590322.1 Enoyl-CoA hydratase [Cupriavidus sp. U2]